MGSVRRKKCGTKIHQEVRHERRHDADGPPRWSDELGEGEEREEEREGEAAVLPAAQASASFSFWKSSWTKR